MRSLRLAYRPRAKLAVGRFARVVFVSSKYAGEGHCSPAWKEQLILLGAFVDSTV